MSITESNYKTYSTEYMILRVVKSKILMIIYKKNKKELMVKLIGLI